VHRAGQLGGKNGCIFARKGCGASLRAAVHRQSQGWLDGALRASAVRLVATVHRRFAEWDDKSAWRVTGHCLVQHADALRGSSERVIEEVAVAVRRCCLCVAEKLTDDRERQPSAGEDRSIGMPQVV
jgi:hypothetical protein